MAGTDEAVAEALLAGAVGGAPGSRRRGRFHTLRVAEIRPLTDAAIEVTFAVPPELAGDYDYLAGQHVALRAQVDGHELRRSYSLCRPPEPTAISVAIKRDAGGRFSSWARRAPSPPRSPSWTAPMSPASRPGRASRP